MSTTWMRVLAIAGLVVGGLACGSEEVTVPTAAQLADRLVDAGTFDGSWTVNAPEGAPEAVIDGVVTDETVDQLPRMEFCPAASAEARALVEDLRWMAFRQLDLAVDDPIDPPADRTGHMVSVQEFLISGEPDEMAATFATLRDGAAACLGEVPAGDEGPGFAEEMPLPVVGDDRYGAMLTMEEAGGWAEWRLHVALVRDGAVLVWITIVDIRAGDEPFYTVDEIGRMVETAVDLL
jgi:hypothetical protein